MTRPTSPSAVTTGSLSRTPFFRPRRDHDRLRERSGGPADHLGRDRLEVAREARPVDVVLQRAQIVVLLQRELALDRPLAQLPVLDAQALGLGSGRAQAVRPLVGVSERLRQALEADREGLQDGGAGGMDAAQLAVLTGAEGHRDEDQREQHETAHREPPAKRPATP